jgi:hypothetical protein
MGENGDRPRLLAIPNLTKSCGANENQATFTHEDQATKMGTDPVCL